ncbi:MAG: NAD(P)/FAD-dependent oxidoreductase [Chloroflexota bacterium]
MPAVETARHSAEAHVRLRSLWLEQVAEPLTPRPPLAGDRDADVVIVGAGYTGLWTAFYLRRLMPDVRVVVLEREVAGFGASGRNGGWVMGVPPGIPERYVRTRGRDAVRRLIAASADTVDEIGRVVEAEGIDCGFRIGGALSVATSRAQLARTRAIVARDRELGVRDEDVRWLERDELAARVRIQGALGAVLHARSGRVQPARLARGLARAVERHGVTIHEGTPVTEARAGAVVTPSGTIRAPHVVLATEAFTIGLPGNARRYLPLYSLMVATEPLPAAAWADIGWNGGETLGDEKHLFCYAQRTEDDRIAIGGRGGVYRLGSPIDEALTRNPNVGDRLRRTIDAYWPAAGGARLTHHWGGAIAVPRDWCASIQLDAATGIVTAGGYAGHGVAQANLAGRTVADLILGRQTELVDLPWVGHRSRSWEPEPLRKIAATAIVNVLGSADRVEDRTGRPARRMALVKPFVPG